MVDYGNFHPVVNHYRWFVETLDHIARIYLLGQSHLLCRNIISHLGGFVKCFLFCVVCVVGLNDVFSKQMPKLEGTHGTVVSKVGGFFGFNTPLKPCINGRKIII